MDETKLTNHTLSFDQFRQMIADNLGFEMDKLQEDTSFLDDLGIDSLSLINFIIALEKKYAIKIELDTVWELKTIGQAYTLFMEKLNLISNENE